MVDKNIIQDKMGFLILIYNIFVFEILFLVKFTYRNYSDRKEVKFKSHLYYSNSSNQFFSMKDGTLWLITVFYTVFGVIILIFNHVFPEHANSVIENIYSIEAIVIAYVALVISTLVFSISLAPKEYYLINTRMDIIKKYNLHIVFQFMGISGFVSICTCFLCQNKIQESHFFFVMFWLFEISVMAIMIFGVVAIVIIGMIMFGDSKFELKSLKILYKIFESNKSFKITGASKDVIDVNLGFLLNLYVKSFSKINKREINDIEYWDTPLYEENIYKVASNVIIIGYVVLVCFGYLFSHSKLEFCWAYFMLLIIFTVLKVDDRFFCEVISFIMGENGYLVIEDKKNIFVGDGHLSSLLYRKHSAFICNVKNIMALYFILCSCLGDKYPKEICKSVNDMIDFLAEDISKKKDFEKLLYYLPVFASSFYVFLLFCEDEDDHIKKLQDKIYELIPTTISENEKTKYYNILNGFIVNVSKYRPNEFDKKNEIKDINRIDYYNDYIKKTGYWTFVTKKNDV